MGIFSRTGKNYKRSRLLKEGINCEELQGQVKSTVLACLPRISPKLSVKERIGTVLEDFDTSESSE